MSEELQRFSASLQPVPPSAPDSFDREIASAFHPLERPEPAGDFAIRDYWRVLHTRRWTIAWLVAASLAAAVIYNYVMVPTYRAIATLQIDREEPDMARLHDDFYRLPEQPDYIETQYKILKSRNLARRVIERLSMDRLPEFARGAEAAPLPYAPEAPGPGENQTHPSVVDAFLDRLSVDPGKGTRLVSVSFESIDRSLAQRVVNTLAEEYIEHNLEAKWGATQKASAWLQQQLSTLKAKLETSESELHDYATKHSILFVEERKDITSEKLAQLEDELTRAEADRIQKQALEMLAEETLRTGGALPGSLSSSTFQEFQSQLSALRREHSQLLVTFAPGYPKVQRVERQIEELLGSIEAEKNRILGSVKESFQLALKREQLLLGAVTRQRKLVNRLSDDFIQYNILKRDAETNRQLYEGLLQRLKEAGITAGLRASNIAILDPAELPEKSYRPRKLLNILLALVAGVVLGVGQAFLQDHLNTVVHRPEEVQRMMGLCLLAVIPRGRRKRFTRLATKPLLSGCVPRGAAGPAGQATARAANGTASSRSVSGRRECVRWDPEPVLAEAYRTLRSSVLLGWEESMRRILVTSSQPQEGKTSVSLNLACSLAQLGRRVLVIDADMRRPACGSLLQVDPESGLTDYLQGLAELDQVIVETPVLGLSVIAGGRSSAVASDLVYSPRLRALLQEASGRFEHVIVDSPPSLVLSDARTISRWVEGVILVVSDTTERGSLLRTKQMFDDAGVRFLGFVMNRIDLNNLNYGYYRDYGYYYTYSADT